MLISSDKGPKKRRCNLSDEVQVAFLNHLSSSTNAQSPEGPELGCLAGVIVEFLAALPQRAGAEA